MPSEGHATKSAAPRRLLIAKVARKLPDVSPVQSGSDSSDNSPASEVPPHSSNLKRLPVRATLATKAARKVHFETQDGSDSDNTTHAQPSRHRAQEHRPQPPRPQKVSHAKQSGGKKAQRSRRSVSNQVDDVNDLVAKGGRKSHFWLRRDQVAMWKYERSVKERPNTERQYARMSTGSSNQRGPQNPSQPQPTKRRRWFFHNGDLGLPGRHREGTSHRGNGNTPQLATKSVPRKTADRPRSPSPDWQYDEEDDISYSLEDTNVVLDDTANESISTSENDDVLEHIDPSQTLLQLLEQHLSSLRLQRMHRLPFLRRNLRDGFQRRCKILGVERQPHSLPRASINVVYSCPVTNGASSHTAKSSMKDWLCPLCDLHEKFAHQRELEKHLAWDHPGVTTQWDRHHTTLSLIIPDTQPEPNVRVRQVSTREPSTSEVSSDSRHADRSESTESDWKPPFRASSTTAGMANKSIVSVSGSTAPTSIEEDLKPKYDPFGYSNDAIADTRSRSSSVSGRSTSQASSGINVEDSLGPSLSYPYLSETDDRGDVHYSCRPGGPRLFDFLNTLSLKPYGVLKWVIVDREEELFELDDILDEDKVMQALWFRWIFLNRNKFVANYFDGTKAFIEDNLDLIKLGAGLLALRMWLLVLLVNNFLLPTEVATLMRHYQGLAGIRQ